MASKTRELNERDTKLVQWLNEAHVKEVELETALAGHIGLTDKAPYKKRLQQHLKETREHKRLVARRIKALGGQPSTGPAVPAAPKVVGAAAGRAKAAVKGQVAAARALVTDQADTHVRNAQEELREEHVEIALYLRIETLATAVADTDTAKLAKGIRRDEERMAKYLTAELPRLVKDVVRAEIPRDQRATSPRSRRRTTSRSRAASSRTRSAA
jgi:ferritin-like metal-binding protein YciE